jgi:hypothetical protein
MHGVYRLSAPHVLLIPFDASPLKQTPKLVLERLLRVVGFLVADVFPSWVYGGMADRESRIPGLPGEILQRVMVHFDPGAQTCLELADHVRNGCTTAQLKQEMNMIRHPAHNERLAAGFIHCTTEDFEQVFSPIMADCRMAVFGGENGMDVNE